MIREKKNGAPGGSRTPDPLLRRQMLYPAELQAQRACLTTKFETKKSGAAEWIRTTTVLLPPAPQAGASASSATTALQKRNPACNRKNHFFTSRPIPSGATDWRAMEGPGRPEQREPPELPEPPERGPPVLLPVRPAQAC